MEKLKLSVIVPVYNVEKYLSECIESIINQTYKNIEIICVNDGSTDASRQILKDYQKKDPRIIIIDKQNQGLAAARNTGLEVISGELVSFLDSDDWLELDFYEKLITQMLQDNSDIAVGETHYIYDDHVSTSEWVNNFNFNKVRKNIIDKVLDKQYLIYSCACWNKVYKTLLIKQNNIKFPHGLYIEDVPFTFASIIKAKKISMVMGAVLNYRQQKNSIMKKARENRTPFDIFKVYDYCEHIFNELQLDATERKAYKQILDNFEIFNILAWSRIVCNKYQQEFFEKMKAKFSTIKIKNNKYIDKNSKYIYFAVIKSKNLKQVYKYLENRKLKILQQIFSIRNYGVRKVITILGIKFKFKSKKLIQRQQELSFDNKLDLLFEELNIIKQQLTIQKFSGINSALNISDKSKYKNSFLLFRYNYLNALNEWGVNLGDYVQTLATQHVINTIFNNITFKYWDRDNLSNYSGEEVFTVMQGWFSHSSDYLPNDKILPVFIGTHITTAKREEFIRFVTCNYEYFKDITFGCRDTSTLKFMQNLGLKSYLSRCLTLTLPKRKIKETQNKVYIVDIPSDMLKYIPQAIRDNAIYRTQRSIDGNQETSFYINSEPRYMEQTSKLLQEYRDNAKLIITSALHCASPGIAMGIPTILIDFEDRNDRFGSLNNIFKINTKEDLINGKINFQPTPVDIEELKQLMINNVELSIKQSFGENIDNKKLNTIREQIANYKII